MLGGCEAVTRVIADYRVDQLFLALPLEAHHEVLKVLNAIEGELVDVKMVPDVLQFVTLRAAVEELRRACPSSASRSRPSPAGRGCSSVAPTSRWARSAWSFCPRCSARSRS